jgi:SAM-dependent methyltransferase
VDPDYRAVYDALAARYDRDASGRYFGCVLAWLRTRLAPGSRVLDVGCGTGRYALALAALGFEVVGVDESPEMIRHARQKVGAGRVRFEVANAASGLPDGPFDAVAMIDSWEFFPDPAKLLWQASAVVRPGGAVVIVTPHPGWRIPLTLAERLGIKKLAPAYGYRNGSRRVIEVAALASGLAVREIATLYGSLARLAVLEAPARDPADGVPGDRGRPAPALADR